MPTGVGVYVRNISTKTHRSAATLAEKCRKYGISFVALQACWQDPKTGQHRDSNKGKLAGYGAALRAQGIDVWVWGFPMPGMEERFTTRMREAADNAGAVGILLDPEKYHGENEAADDLRALTIDSLTESLGLGMTSWALPRYHKSFPWYVLAGLGWGSPQIYTLTDRQALESVEDWVDLGWTHIVPSIAAFGPKSGHAMRETLSRYHECPGVIVWSYTQIDDDEWKTLSDFADLLRSKGVS